MKYEKRGGNMIIIDEIKTLEDGIEFFKNRFSSEDKEETERMIEHMEKEVKKLKESYDFNINSIREKTDWYFVHLFAKEWETMKKEHERCHIEFEENEKLFIVYLVTEEELIIWQHYKVNGNRARYSHNTKKISDICKKVL